MINTVITENYCLPEFDIREIMLYMGDKSCSENVSVLIESCISECSNSFKFNVCHSIFDITVAQNKIELPFGIIHSRSLSTHLENCNKAVVFAATVGIEIDRLISKYSRLSPAKALCFQAIGTERIETLCDIFEKDISENLKNTGFITKQRFSPGYGDFDILFQKDIFNVLNCQRKIGLTLNSSMIMSPSKSVTAIIGIKDAGKE